MSSQPRPSAPRPSSKPTQLRWSNRTMILLSTGVGFSTFLMGLNQGYRAGKAQGIKEATSPASQTDPASADSAIGGNTA